MAKTTAMVAATMATNAMHRTILKDSAKATKLVAMATNAATISVTKEITRCENAVVCAK